MHQTGLEAYVYAVKLKTGPIVALLKLKTGPFFVFFYFANLILPAERRGILKNKQKTTKTQFFKVKNLSNYVAQHAWTSF